MSDGNDAAQPVQMKAHQFLSGPERRLQGILSLHT